MPAIDPNLIRSAAESGSAATLAEAIEALITQVNLGPATAGMHFTDPGTVTTITTQSAFTKAANTTEAHLLSRWTMPTDNRLQYDGEQDVRALVIATLSFTCETNNQILEFAVGVNGDVDADSVSRTKITTGTDVKSVTVMAHVTMSTGDYAEIFVSNTSSDSDITVEHGHVFAIGFP